MVNQGASITQQVIVQGDANFSGPTVATQEPDPSEDLATYTHAVRGRYMVNHFVGFTVPIEHGLTWEDLYVELDMAKDHGGSKREVFAGRRGEVDGEPPMQDRQRVGLDDAFEHARRHNKRAMVMLGDPGSGKTTQLQQMLLRVLDPERGPETLGLPHGTLPVFVPIRELQLPSGGPIPRLEDLVREALSNMLAGVSAELAARLLAQPCVLFLLDGLDEVPDEHERTRMAKVIASAQKRLGHHYLMVSSRYAGYADVKAVHLGNAFLELRLEPLDDEQVERLVHKWHEAVDKMDAKDEGRLPSPETAEERAQALLDRLDLNEEGRLAQLARSPLLLTALCLIHRERASEGGLPSERADVYSTCEEILLEHWQRQEKGRELLEHLERKLDGRREVFDAELARRVLQPVAYWLHRQEKRRDATVTELCDPVRGGLAAVGRSDVRAEDFVRSFATESGLLTPYGPTRHGFIHLGFQEHLAALHMRERWSHEPQILADLVEGRGEGWWREVSRMTLDQADPGLLTGFLDRLTPRPELKAWSRTRMLAACLRASPRTMMATLSTLLQEPSGTVGVERQLTAVRLLVQHVVPNLPSSDVGPLDALLRAHPVEVVRRRWMERPTSGGARETKVVAGVELVRLPAGWVSMGSAQDDDAAYDDDEWPQHEVELASFWLPRTPVTNSQYREYLKAKPRVTKPEYWNDPEYNQPEQPVVGVSWKEAQAYCKWAGLSLPTEAQWEYACRAGTTTRYSSGDGEDELKKVGWYHGNSGGRLHAVRELEPNDWGLYDMHGNVWEWCEDAFGGYETSPRAGDGLRHEPVGGAIRVVRGGTFGDWARYARSAFRYGYEPGDRWPDLGFRPAQGHP